MASSTRALAKSSDGGRPGDVFCKFRSVLGPCCRNRTVETAVTCRDSLRRQARDGACDCYCRLPLQMQARAAIAAGCQAPVPGLPRLPGPLLSRSVLAPLHCAAMGFFSRLKIKVGHWARAWSRRHSLRRLLLQAAATPHSHSMCSCTGHAQPAALAFNHTVHCQDVNMTQPHTLCPCTEEGGGRVCGPGCAASGSRA